MESFTQCTVRKIADFSSYDVILGLILTHIHCIKCIAKLRSVNVYTHVQKCPMLYSHIHPNKCDLDGQWLYTGHYLQNVLNERLWSAGTSNWCHVRVGHDPGHLQRYLLK